MAVIHFSWKKSQIIYLQYLKNTHKHGMLVAQHMHDHDPY